MGILKMLGKFASDEIFDDLGSKIGETIEDTKAKIAESTKTVLKTITLWAIALVGMIFLLIGAAKTVETEFVQFAGGYGFIIVGGILIVFTLFVKLLK